MLLQHLRSLLLDGLLNDRIIGHGDFKFKLDKKWSSQDIYKHPVNHCHEMVIDSRNRLYMTTTHVKNNILVYNRDGKVLDSYNLNLPGAHGLTLSNEGGMNFYMSPILTIINFVKQL